MQRSKNQSGFSAVELLVTLFIAVIFLAAGHQMYNAIIQDSGTARQRSRANNVAYDYLRRYAASAPATCAASTPVNDVAATPTPTGLANVRATVVYSCPQPSLTNLTKVQVTIRYGTSSEEVSHAIYTTQ